MTTQPPSPSEGPEGSAGSQGSSDKKNPGYKLTFPWEANLGELNTLQKEKARKKLFEMSLKPGEDSVPCGDVNCDRPIYDYELDNNGGKEEITLHHMIKLGRRCCNWLLFMRLAHKSCNSRLGRARELHQVMGLPGSTGVRTLPTVRENPSVLTDADASPPKPVITSTTELLHSVVNYMEGSIEMQANYFSEPKWMDFMCQSILSHKKMTKHDSLGQGAGFSGWNAASAYRAYNKYVYQPKKSFLPNIISPFVEEEDKKTKRPIVRLRFGWKIVEVEKGKFRPVPKTTDETETDARNTSDSELEE